MNIRPQFITDSNGKKISVVLSLKEYDKLMEELDEKEDVRLYDEAKKSDNGERILFAEYLKKRNSKNANIPGSNKQKSRKAIR